MKKKKINQNTLHEDAKKYIMSVKKLVYEKLHIIMGEDDIPNIDAIKSIPISMGIAENKYKYSYVMSDIHADFRKFLMMLIRGNIIALYDSITGIKQTSTQIDTILNDIATTETYIYDVVSTYEFQFVNSSTNLIILGDLVDGKRDYGTYKDYGADVDFFHKKKTTHQ